MAGQLEGKVALITGAARGVGKAIAERFAREGAQVVIDDVDDAAGQATAEVIVAAGGSARYIHADIGKAEAVEALIAGTVRMFGPVDILVNNALPPSRHVVNNDWDPLIDVCLKGPWLLMQAVLPSMIERRSGSIINISSVNGLAGFGDEHVYSAAKAGLIGMSRSMATRYGRKGVRINVICPGSIATDAWNLMLERDPGLHERLVGLYPIGRLGNPDDIAGAALYLAGPDAGFTTGSVMVVDGGITAGNTGFSIWDED
ncbi:MAG TPA: SDR family NAD(P)-dependent oxidoreductase [Chloroflexota bacterium]|nr:SDR family NAD(P)-dependent oxidoreductase [Chloroflexota bacterium]